MTETDSLSCYRNQSVLLTDFEQSVLCLQKKKAAGAAFFFIDLRSMMLP